MLLLLDKVDMIVKLIEEYYGRTKVNLVIGQQLYHANVSKLDEEIDNNFHFEEDSGFLEFLQQNERQNDPGRSPAPGASRGRKSYSRSPDKRQERRSGERGRSRRSSGSPRRRTSSGDKSSRARRLSSPDRHRETKQRSPKDLRSRIKGKSKQARRASESKSRSRSRSKSLVITITRSKSRSRSRGDKGKKRKKSKLRKRRSGSSSSSERDNDRRRKRQQLSGRSSTPSKKSKKEEDIRGCNDAELSEKYNRVRFLKEEGLAVEKLVQEKKEFMFKPTKHPLYNEQWKVFYRRQEKKYGDATKKMDLNSPWSKCWLEFLEVEFKQKSAKMKRELEIKYRITSSDSGNNSRGQAETVTLSESDSDDVVELREEPTPLSPKNIRQPSTSRNKGEKEKSDPDIKPNLSTLNVSRASVKVEQSNYQVPEDELNVISLLKILMALSSKGLLDSEKVKKMQNFALTLENGRFGSSQMLVDEKECFNTVDQAGETLRVKLSMGQVPEIHKKPVQLALDQIKLFIAKSCCQKSDILEVANFSPLRSEDLAETKMKIAKTIEQELRNCNRVVTQEEFNKLVEAEYVRVKYKMSSNSSSARPSNNSQAPVSISQMSQPSVGELFNTYLNPPPPPQFPAASNFPQVPEISGIQPVVDWGQINRALEIAKSLDQRRSPPRVVHSAINIQEKPAQIELEEEEIVSLIRNIKNLDETSKKSLMDHMKELERLDPEKVMRIKRKLIDTR